MTTVADVDLSTWNRYPSSPRLRGSNPFGLLTATSLTRHAITWTFSEAVTYGQYVNGDYWVIDSGSGVSVTDISPLSTDVGGWITNGSMINPHRALEQGYDSTGTLTYRAIDNMGRPSGADLTSGNPLVLVTGDSLISTKSVGTQNNWPQLSDASVLTVVSSAPASGSFRPPYTNGSKAHNWNISDIDWSLLASKQVSKTPIANLPTLSAIEASVGRVWLDHHDSWQFGRLQPANNMSDYGREISEDTAEAALTLLLDYTQTQLEPIMLGYLQIGIDLYELAAQGQQWRADGGIFNGRKLPILFAGLMFNDANMLAIANGATNFIFQEDQQTDYVTQLLVDVSATGTIESGGDWRVDVRNVDYAPYTAPMVGNAEWGVRYLGWTIGAESDPPNYSSWAPDSDWGAKYRANNAGGNSGAALATIMLGAETSWNYPAFFEHLDRYVTANQAAEHSYWTTGANSSTALIIDMWEEYRVDYP